jgi:F-type H+-transporting ATPase subunit a
MLAGEILLLMMAFLIPYFLPLPFYGLELLVGFIQALVFASLAIVYLSVAVTPHAEEH